MKLASLAVSVLFIAILSAIADANDAMVYLENGTLRVWTSDDQPHTDGTLSAARLDWEGFSSKLTVWENADGAGIYCRFDVANNPAWLDVNVVQTSGGVFVTELNTYTDEGREWWYGSWRDFCDDRNGDAKLVLNFLHRCELGPVGIDDIRVAVADEPSEADQIACRHLLSQLDDPEWHVRSAAIAELHAYRYAVILAEMDKGGLSVEQRVRVCVILQDMAIRLPDGFIAFAME